MAMPVYGLCSSIEWHFTETPNSQLEQYKTGRLELDDLIGVYRNTVPITPHQGSRTLLLKMTSKGARKCVFGSMLEMDLETLDKKKGTKQTNVMSIVYPNSMIDTIEKSSQMQKLVMIANLTVQIDDLKKGILSIGNAETKLEELMLMTQLLKTQITQNQPEPKGPAVKTRVKKRKTKNGKSKRRARV